jgi:hypothetical protein
MKPTWSWCMTVLIFCLPIFYWGFLHLSSLKRLTYNSLFCFITGHFWDQCHTGFIEWVWQCYFLFYFMKKFEECWYQLLFKGLVEFSSESIWSWTLIFRETLYCCFHFIAFYKSVLVIHILLVQFDMVICV